MKTNSQNNPEFRVELSERVLENALRRELDTHNQMLIHAIMKFVPSNTLYKVLMHDYPEPEFAEGDIVELVNVSQSRILGSPCSPFVVKDVSVFGSYRQQPEYTIEYETVMQQAEGEELCETRTIRVEQSNVGLCEPPSAAYAMQD